MHNVASARMSFPPNSSNRQNISLTVLAAAAARMSLSRTRSDSERELDQLRNGAGDGGKGKGAAGGNGASKASGEDDKFQRGAVGLIRQAYGFVVGLLGNSL